MSTINQGDGIMANSQIRMGHEGSDTDIIGMCDFMTTTTSESGIVVSRFYSQSKLRVFVMVRFRKRFQTTFHTNQTKYISRGEKHIQSGNR